MFAWLRRVARLAATVVPVPLVALAACQERKAAPETVAVVSTGGVSSACTGDLLRPAAAAPAEGLWSFEEPGTGRRVAARIGPPRSDDRMLVVSRPVETLEVTPGTDTIRQRIEAATVSLELLPPLGIATLGLNQAADTTVSSHPAATYAPSPNIRLAAYEPCVTSSAGPRTRYLRRDPAGRIVTDVMLRRSSDR